MDNYLKGMVEEPAENLEKPWPGPEDIVRMRGKEQKEQIAESMRKSWRDCCDCKHEIEIETASCHECFDDPARPHWERKEPPKPTREMGERRFVILLADTEQTWGLPCITEKELLQRCIVMCVEYEKYGTVRMDLLLPVPKE